MLAGGGGTLEMGVQVLRGEAWGRAWPACLSFFLYSYIHSFIQQTLITYCVPSIRDTAGTQTNKVYVLLELTLKAINK